MRSALHKVFTFPDGLFILVGSFLVISLIHTRTDENLYPDAHSFKNRFRFSETIGMDEGSEGEQKKRGIVLIARWITFSSRSDQVLMFFVAVGLKLFLSHIVI